MKKLTIILGLAVTLSGCAVYPQYPHYSYERVYIQNQYQSVNSYENSRYHNYELHVNNSDRYYNSKQEQYRDTYPHSAKRYEPAYSDYYRRDNYEPYSYSRPIQPNSGGAVLGAVSGGLIGSNVGRGNGKVAATAAGAAIGSVVGSGCRTTNGGQILGAIAGGLLGSNIGGGSGKAVAAATGAALGANVGGQMAGGCQ